MSNLLFLIQKTRLICSRAIIAILPLFLVLGNLKAEDTFVTIGGGDISGVYFSAGWAIAKIVNKKRDVHGIRVSVEATSGSTFNLNAVLAGYMEFGLAQSDRQYEAVKGLANWADRGRQRQLRSVFSLHDEVLTLVVGADSDIRSVADLKGKRVRTGSPGSSQNRIVIDALETAGLDPGRDILASRVIASDAATLFQDERIDAYFFTVGHPSDAIRQGLSGKRKGRIVPISGPAIDRLVSENPHYIAATIPVGRLYPTAGNQGDVATFGVIATLCTSSTIPDDVVYVLTKEVFENLEILRQQHPAIQHLAKENMLRGLSAPLHPGALRYYMEIGLEAVPEGTGVRQGGGGQ